MKKMKKMKKSRKIFKKRLEFVPLLCYIIAKSLGRVNFRRAFPLGLNAD